MILFSLKNFNLHLVVDAPRSSRGHLLAKSRKKWGRRHSSPVQASRFPRVGRDAPCLPREEGARHAPLCAVVAHAPSGDTPKSGDLCNRKVSHACLPSTNGLPIVYQRIMHIADIGNMHLQTNLP